MLSPVDIGHVRTANLNQVARKGLKSMKHQNFMKRAIVLAREGMKSGEGGPFGAVIVKDGEIIGEGCNMVIAINDPTAHAEIMAIRNACRALSNFSLLGCDIHTSCEPCPMCLGAIYWARIRRVYFAAMNHDAREAGFDDYKLYAEFARGFKSGAIEFKPASLKLRKEVLAEFNEWKEKADKVLY